LPIIDPARPCASCLHLYADHNTTSLDRFCMRDCPCRRFTADPAVCDNPLPAQCQNSDCKATRAGEDTRYCTTHYKMHHGIEYGSMPGQLTTSDSGGEKFVKPERYSLIPVEPLADLARLYGFGAEKYAPRGWENGFEWDKAKDALMRHLEQFWAGEDLDDGPGGSGLPHVTAVAFWAFALHEFRRTHPEYDNRPGSDYEPPSKTPAS
jgi:hypothetical protein